MDTKLSEPGQILIQGDDSTKSISSFFVLLCKKQSCFFGISDPFQTSFLLLMVDRYIWRFFSLMSNSGITTLTPWDFFTHPYQGQLHALLSKILLHLPGTDTTFSPLSFQFHGQLGSHAWFLHVPNSYSGLDHNIHPPTPLQE